MNTILDTLFQWDLNIVMWVQSHLNADIFNAFWIALTTVGNKGAIWIVLSLCLIAYPKTRKIGFTCALALIFSLIAVNIGLKNIVARPRPFSYFDTSLLIKEPDDFSFPSGHTSASFAAAFVLYKYKFQMGRYRLYAYALVLAFLMSFSRLYLSVHFPSDILAGGIIGLLCAELAYRIITFRNTAPLNKEK